MLVFLAFFTEGAFISGSYSHSAAWTFLGISMSTGPFLPSLAISKASWIVCWRSLISRTMKLCFTMGWVIPTISTSWKESFPRLLTATFPVMATMGTESRYALAMPVTRLVAPGPLVARTTPVFPLALA